MATYNLNQVKVGLKIVVDGDPCVIVAADVVKPGKGQAFTKVKYKNYKTERVNERTLKASDAFEGADIVDTEMQYLYTDGRTWTFMNQQTYDQVEADAITVGDKKQFLIEQDICLITLHDGIPIVVTPPNFVVLEIVETDPGVKGDTSGGGNKPATTDTGAVIRVPLFVQIGEKVKVDTRTGDYVSRA
jgi:elongation factor P